MTRREELAQVRERHAEWGAETPGGPALSSAERGLLLFQAGYDRRFLLGLVDELAAALELLADDGEFWAPEGARAYRAARKLLSDLGPDA